MDIFRNLNWHSLDLLRPLMYISNVKYIAANFESAKYEEEWAFHLITKVTYTFDLNLSKDEQTVNDCWL